MAWRVARALDVLLAEINDAAPGRSKISDGSIGDAAHASRSSDHNPWVTVGGEGIVRARDFTHDPDDGCDAGVIAEAVRQLGLRRAHPALGTGAYVIWDRQIASATYGWVWRPYTGSNPHDKHCHVSVAVAASGFDSTAPWGVMRSPKPVTPEDEMADYAKQLDRIERKQDTILSRLRAGGEVRSKLRILVKQGRADARELDELRALVDELTADDEPQTRGKR